jgi:hypothetical protein
MVLRVASTTFKALMRHSMEAIGLAVSEPYIRIFIDYFNLLFANSHNSANYWRNELSSSILATFFYTVQPRPTELSAALSKEGVDMATLFKKFPQRTGMKLKPKFIQNTEESFELFLSQQQVLSEGDIKEMVPVAKNLSFFKQAEAMWIISNAEETQNKEQLGKAMDLLEEACVTGSPSSLMIFRYWCRAWYFKSMPHERLPPIFQFGRRVLDSILSGEIKVDKNLEIAFAKDLTELVSISKRDPDEGYFSKVKYADLVMHPAVLGLYGANLQEVISFIGQILIF